MNALQNDQLLELKRLRRQATRQAALSDQSMDFDRHWSIALSLDAMIQRIERRDRRIASRRVIVLFPDDHAVYDLPAQDKGVA